MSRPPSFFDKHDLSQLTRHWASDTVSSPADVNIFLIILTGQPCKEMGRKEPGVTAPGVLGIRTIYTLLMRYRSAVPS
jgi:hypothetical protein